VSDNDRVTTSLDFRLLFEASPDVLLVLLPDSPRFTMVAATEARLQATHTTREDTLGRGLFEIFPDNPDDPAATGTNNLRASLERVLLTGEADTMAVQKYDIRGPDGTFQSKYWSPKNIPVISGAGEVTFILHRVEDVTDLVQASELGQQLRDRTQKMERDVIVRSRELAQANQDLREANARLGELDSAKTAFFSNVSHEFRTPLTLLLGPLENAIGRKPPGLSGEEIVAMHRNAVRLLRLVNSLLDFSRIEGGGLRLRFAPTDLAKLTAGLAGSFQSLMDEAGIGFVVECPALPEMVYVDRVQWEKIVLNLISNAFKFTFKGRIRVALEWHGDHVEFKVEDTGTGIPEAELAHIFERFHRVAGAKGRSFEGTGIGLALVDELARLHSGSVRVTSTLGAGSTFTVSVPTGTAHVPPGGIRPEGDDDENPSPNQKFEARQWLAREASGDLPDGESFSSPPPGRSSPPNGESTVRRSRVLVVDDNADMRGYVASLLTPYWDVEVASDGAAALASARRSPPDLVLSDVMMPVMDGVTLLEELRRDPTTNLIPVVLVSARAGEDARIEGLETGADDYLVKPFATRELLARVGTHLTMARVRKNAGDTARELAETRARLIQELEQTNRNLVESYNQLAATQAQLIHSAKMASLGELVAGIAHEINNPLAFVKSHLSTVRRTLDAIEADFSAQLNESQAQARWGKVHSRLVEMERGIERIQELIVKLRTFSRLDEGERKVASVRECVDSIVTILHHRVRDRIEVVLELEGPDLLDCYPGLLNQALMNLVANAIDAVGETGTIRISSSEQEGVFRLSVSDTGPGVPKALRERILEPFFTTKPVGHGTGLGLSIAYSIAKKHGGDLDVTDAPHSGAMFTLSFPVERASS
jgi:signal transduction histidine kinase